MESLYETLMSDPLYQGLAGLLVLLLLVSLIKQVLKLAILTALCGGILVAVLHFSGGAELPATPEELKHSLMEGGKKAQKKVQAVIDDQSEKATEAIRQGVEDGVRKSVQEELEKQRPPATPTAP